MYTLIIEDRYGRSAAEISFDQGSYTSGRVDGNDVGLPSSSVSRTHARIFVSNNKCYIDDLGSANGVTVDNIPIKERTEIKNGSQIRIGEYTLYLEYKDQSDMNAGQDVLKTQIVSGDQGGYKIVRIRDKFAGEEFMLAEATNTIGRTEDNYILLSDQSISRNHAKITNRGMLFYVTDLDSSNGTFVNNKKITGEHPLQAGDIIRFGNLSFVFVPSSQHVNILEYAKNNQKSSQPLIFGAVGAFVVIVVIVLIVAMVIKKSDGDTPAGTEVTVQDTAIAKLNIDLDNAAKHLDDKQVQAAKYIIDPLLKEYPDDSRVKELNKKIEFELKNDEFITQGNAFVDHKKYDDAIDKFRSVDPDSFRYDDAQNLIKDTERKIRLMQYNEARSKCDDGLSDECIKDLCAAAADMKNRDSDIETERVNDTIAFMERITKTKKNKYAASAKECLDELQN